MTGWTMPRWIARLIRSQSRPSSLVHYSEGASPLCYQREERPRRGSVVTPVREAVTCRRCIAAMLDAAQDAAHYEDARR